MKKTDLANAKLIYNADIQFTNMIEYGVSMEAITIGETSIPSGGARFDQTFEGKIQAHLEANTF